MLIRLSNNIMHHFLRVYFYCDYFTSSATTFEERLGHELFSALTQHPQVINVIYKTTRLCRNFKSKSPFDLYVAPIYGYITFLWDDRDASYITPYQLLKGFTLLYAPVHIHIKNFEVLSGRRIVGSQANRKFINIRWKRYFESRKTWLE